MKRTGRVNILVIFAIVGIVVLVILALMSGSSPSTAAARFLTALQKKDVKTLVELSDVDDKDKAALEQKFTNTVNVAGKYYNFRWRIITQQIDGDAASIKLQYIMNADSPSSYEENIDLPMVKKGGNWKVAVYEIPRKLHPGLPRASIQE